MRKVLLGDICKPKQWKTISASMLTEDGYPVYGANGVIGKYSEYNHEKETLLITCREQHAEILIFANHILCKWECNGFR